MKNGKWSIQTELTAPEGDGSGGGGTGTTGAGVGSGTSGTGTGTGDGATGATGATGTGTTAGGSGSGTTGTGQGTTGAPKFTYDQDRTDWVPPHRFREVSQTAKQAREYQQRYETAQRQLQALTGAAPPDPNAQSANQVRDAFKQMFPGLAKLDDARIDRLLHMADQSDQIEATTNHYWQGVGQQMVGGASEQVAEALGVDELTPSQQKRVAQAYVSMLNEDFQQARSEGRNSSLLQRHEARDPKLIAEFVKQFTDDFIEPVRRRAVQANVGRVSQRVPSGRATTNTSINTKPKIDFTNDKATEDAAVEAFLAHGGGFGKR